MAAAKLRRLDVQAILGLLELGLFYVDGIRSHGHIDLNFRVLFRQIRSERELAADTQEKGVTEFKKLPDGELAWLVEGERR